VGLRPKTRRRCGLICPSIAYGRVPAAPLTIYNTFYVQPHLIRRSTLRYFRGAALRMWTDAVAASFGSARIDHAWAG
jgi:hypothetical protein